MHRALNNAKIGNILIYFAEHTGYLALTKAMKLLFLLDERSMIETGVPVTWLEYNAWVLGPVPPELYYELKHNKPKHDIQSGDFDLSQFLSTEKNLSTASSETVVLRPLSKFNPDEFCDYEIGLMEKIMKEYGSMSAAELINITHQEGSLWDIVVSRNNLKQLFQYRNTSEYPVDFLEHIKDSEEKLFAYMAAEESLNFHRETLVHGKRTSEQS